MNKHYQFQLIYLIKYKKAIATLYKVLKFLTP